jgi:hypothetical protein
MPRDTLPRRSKDRALQRIQDIHAWETCDEASARFRAVAAQIERELVGETLSASEREQLEPVEALAEDEDEDEDEDADEGLERRSVDDDASEQDSWIDDDSAPSEDGEWVPVKRLRGAGAEVEVEPDELDDIDESSEAEDSEAEDSQDSEDSEAEADADDNVICLDDDEGLGPGLDPLQLPESSDVSDIEVYCISDTEDSKHPFDSGSHSGGASSESGP